MVEYMSLKAFIGQLDIKRWQDLPHELFKFDFGDGPGVTDQV